MILWRRFEQIMLTIREQLLNNLTDCCFEKKILSIFPVYIYAEFKPYPMNLALVGRKGHCLSKIESTSTSIRRHAKHIANYTIAVLVF